MRGDNHSLELTGDAAANAAEFALLGSENG